MINKDGMYTLRFSAEQPFQMVENSICIFQRGLEARSHYIDRLRDADGGRTVFVEVDFKDNNNDYIMIVGSGKSYSLRSSEDVRMLLGESSGYNIYLDASGLNIKILSALIKQSVRLSLEKGIKVYILYAEPRSYKVKRYCEEGCYHDWATGGFDGISPLPGFGCIVSESDESILVPLLGFQGGRFAYILSQLDVDETKVFPVVGLSGYRPEYSFYSYYGNRQALIENRSWQNIQFAMAGSIVDAAFQLKRIYEKKAKGGFMKIAPIGTKPHAIAAILIASLYPRTTELVYDNPKKDQSRTDGVGMVSVTCVSDLIGAFKRDA